MSDLLTRMITRSARATEGIMPVVPSRYEGSVAAPAVPDALEERVAVESPVRRPEEAPQPRPILRTEAKAIAPRQILEEPREEEDDSTEPAPVDRRRFDDVVPGTRAASPLPVRMRPAAAIFQTPAAAEHKIEEAAAAAEEPEFIPDEWPRFETEAPIAEEPFFRAVPAPAQVLESPLLESPRLQNAPRQTAPRQTAPRRRREAQSPSPQPERTVEVHVSIGHIELRQTAPAPQAVERRVPAAPPVPLENLLGRRRGGAR